MSSQHLSNKSWFTELDFEHPHLHNEIHGSKALDCMREDNLLRTRKHAKNKTNKQTDKKDKTNNKNARHDRLAGSTQSTKIGRVFE